MNLAIDESYRRRGIARRLLEELFAATKDDSMRGYTLEVRVSNTTAITLYEQVGFRITGVRRGYYTDNREDAYVMWKDPIPLQAAEPRAVASRPPSRKAMILALETSCDETAAACLADDGTIVSSVVSSQAELHARYGGVVPEVASRRHLELTMPVVSEALERAEARLDDLEAIAVTRGPGLIGALLVGPLRREGDRVVASPSAHPVDHLHGHVASLFIGARQVEPPFLCLLASGGHTMLLDVRERSGFRVLGTTLDDAAGEAFDKGARLLGLGYPGGAALDALASQGDPSAFRFPVARVPGLDFSFSGLKTALLYAVRDLPGRRARAQACRSRSELPARDRASAPRANDRGCRTDRL